MKMEATPKPYDFPALDGISERSLDEHLSLYRGHIARLNNIRTQLSDIPKLDANSTYDRFRSLKLAETYVINSIKLHEDYFDNLGSPKAAVGPIRDSLEKQYNSFEEWLADFVACGMASRGWAILCLDPFSGSLMNLCQDSNELGALWSSKPILVMDVSEHAYYIDYGTHKREYINAFIRNVNWNAANERMNTSVLPLRQRPEAKAELGSVMYYQAYPVYRARPSKNLRKKSKQ